MHIVWNREMRKLAAAILAVVAMSVLAVNITVTLYGNHVRNQYNGFLASVFGNVASVYPEVPEEELVRVLGGSGNQTYGEELLAHYGVFGTYGSASFAMWERQLLFLRVCANLLLILSILALCGIIGIYFGRRQRQISGLAAYMQALNREGYKLEPEENADDELSGLRNEIYKLTVLLKEQADQAKAQKRVLADSVTNISHQLKTPLTSSIVLLDNLSENPNMDQRTRRHFLEEVTNQLTGMSWLVTSMMKLSRLDAGVVELQAGRFVLRDFVEEVLGRLELAAEMKQLSFALNVPEDVQLYADRKWTAEAFLNLVKNAIEFSPPGGLVEIRAEENDVYTQIQVHDNGAGISREEQDKLFRRFYNGKSAREDSMGIGLALAKEIVEKQRGSIFVSSRAGEGTTFTLRFIKS